MNFVDHSKGHTPAQKGDHRRWDVTLHHNVCGKRIFGSSDTQFSCGGNTCNVYWKPSVMDGFSDDAMATRFHVKVQPDREAYTLVEFVDPFSRTAYTAVVPTAEAHKHKKALL